MNFINAATNSNQLGKATKGASSELDLLGLSQDNLAKVQGDSEFAQLLGQLGEVKDGIQSLLGGEGAESGEQVFELIDGFPKEFKLNFLEELKADLPKLVQGLEENAITGEALKMNPEDIISKIQDVIDLVKDGGEKIADAFKSVFDGGVFESLFKDGKETSPKVLASLEANLKKLTDKPEASQTKVVNPKNILAEGKSESSEEAVELHNFMKKGQAGQKPKNLNQLKQFSKFNSDANVVKAAAPMQEVASQDVKLQNITKKAMKNPYANNMDQKFIQAQTKVQSMEGQTSQGMNDFANQNAQSPNIDMAAMNMSSNKESSADVSAVTGDKPVLNLSQMGDASNSKTELIKNVTNYLEQAQFSNQKELDVAVKHADLGEFNIQVSKDVKTNNIDLQIKAMTDDGVNFFQENEVELMKTLNEKGIKLSSLKIGAKGEASISSGLEKQDSSSTGQNSKEGHSQGFGQHRQHQGKDQRGQQRRQELWQKYQEQMAS